MLDSTITPKPGAMDALTDIVGKMQACTTEALSVKP